MKDVKPTKTVLGVPLYNVEAISEILGVSVQTIREYIREEKIKYTKLGRTFYASEEALKAYLNGEYTKDKESDIE